MIPSFQIGADRASDDGAPSFDGGRHHEMEGLSAKCALPMCLGSTPLRAIAFETLVEIGLEPMERRPIREHHRCQYLLRMDTTTRYEVESSVSETCRNRKVCVVVENDAVSVRTGSRENQIQSGELWFENAA